MLSKETQITSGGILKYVIEDTNNRNFKIAGSSGDLARFDIYNDSTTSDVVIKIPINNQIQTITVKKEESGYFDFVIEGNNVYYGEIISVTPYRFHMFGV